jgi:hypothetical protein
MMNQKTIQRSPDIGTSDSASSKYDPENSESLAITKKNKTATTASPGETPYVGSHAENYDPENEPDRNGQMDGPSGENTKNGGKQGGGLWTSGGQVTTGTPYHDEED